MPRATRPAFCPSRVEQGFHRTQACGWRVPMHAAKKLVKRKDVEQLENTSLAAVGLMDHHNAMDAYCNQDYTCSCGTTVVRCCDSTSLCVATNALFSN